VTRGFGSSPEEAARLLTSSEPHRAYATHDEREEHETRILCDIITEYLKKKTLGGQQPPRQEGFDHSGKKAMASEILEAFAKPMLAFEE